MCLIAYLPSGKTLEEETIWDASFANSDGIGIMYHDNGIVRGVKGIEAEDLKVLLDVHRDKPVVVHFRLATHGLRDFTACHPFPVTNNVSQLRTLTWTHKIGVAHNGIIQGYGSKTLSDTQEFIKEVLSGMTLTKKLPRLSEFLAKETNSKFAFMFDNGAVQLCGSFIEKDGVWFSNLNHEPWTYRNYYKHSVTAVDVCDYCQWNVANPVWETVAVDGEVYHPGEICLCDSCLKEAYRLDSVMEFDGVVFKHPTDVLVMPDWYIE